MENTTQELVQEAIFTNIHCKQFFLEETVPICTGGLQGQFGYNAATRIAKAILAGTYEYPPDFDQATREICEECAQIWEIIPINSLDTLISKNDWSCQWKGCCESTSFVRIRFTFWPLYYRTVLRPHLIFSCIKSNSYYWKGCCFRPLGTGSICYAEKMFGCALITKLRSILLMEADFNATNKIVYGQRMLHQARKYKLIPEEIYSDCNRLADDGILAKVLFYDIVCHSHLPVRISAVDANNCYNRVAHPITSLVFQSLGVPKAAVILLLSTIQAMKFFLRTGFGDSKVHAGSTDGKKTQ